MRIYLKKNNSVWQHRTVLNLIDFPIFPYIRFLSIRKNRLRVFLVITDNFVRFHLLSTPEFYREIYSVMEGRPRLLHHFLISSRRLNPSANRRLVFNGRYIRPGRGLSRIQHLSNMMRIFPPFLLETNKATTMHKVAWVSILCV
jgi:hypothetical protein